MEVKIIQECDKGSEWFPLIGYVGYYEVSSDGDIRSTSRYVKNSRNPLMRKWVKGRVLKPIKGVYLQVSLSKEGIISKCYVHQLIAKTFKNNEYFEGACVNHKDGNKWNNSSDNLEYVSYSQNNKHAYLLGLKLPSKKGASND